MILEDWTLERLGLGGFIATLVCIVTWLIER